MLSYPDFNQPFVLHTDASQDGRKKVTPPEKKLLSTVHSGKLEFLALKWAICEHLLHAPSFVVYTDNNPLTFILTTAKLNETGQRWVAELADFNFTIKYRPGKTNADADGLSRIPMDFEGYTV